MGARLWDCCYTVAGGASCVGHRCGLGLERYRPPPVSQTIAAPGMCSNKLCLYNIAIIALAARQGIRDCCVVESRCAHENETLSVLTARQIKPSVRSTVTVALEIDPVGDVAGWSSALCGADGLTWVKVDTLMSQGSKDPLERAVASCGP
jgi:hypothetical protein